jgi:signal transduction histidine kinase
MKRDSRWRAFWEKARRALDVRFFGQLLIAFSLVVVLVAVGLTLAGRAALNRVEPFIRDKAPPATNPWADRLAGYFEQQGSWDGVEAMVAGYPCGPGWEPWDESWHAGFLLAEAHGEIVAAGGEVRGRPADEWLGQTLDQQDLDRGVPIEVGDQKVGFLFFQPFFLRPGEGPEAFARDVRRNFLLTGLGIAGVTLIVGLVLSRGISRPLAELTSATRAVGAGNLDTRVPVRFGGDARELAIAFNRMAEQLARSDELRRNLTADVAHELRTPLSVIRGKMEAVLDGVYPATSEHLQPILEETDLLTHLVEDLRLLALAEAGQLPLETLPMDLGDLLRDTQVNFGPQATDRDVTLALDLPRQLPPVQADWRRVAQVLGNLLINALRHTPQGGCVTLSAAAGPGVVRVTVADTGPGIPPEDLPYIFERFWRGEKSRSRVGGGTGLGLAIARQLVELHGGSIGVDSTPGAGSAFWFTLPLVEAAG